MARFIGEIVKLPSGGYGLPEEGDCSHCGQRSNKVHRWALLECLGRVFLQDVGKRVYDVSEDGRPIYQVENTEQRDARIGKPRA